MKRETRTVWTDKDGNILMELVPSVIESSGVTYRIPDARFTRERLMELYNAIDDAILSEKCRVTEHEIPGLGRLTVDKGVVALETSYGDGFTPADTERA